MVLNGGSPFDRVDGLGLAGAGRGRAAAAEETMTTLEIMNAVSNWDEATETEMSVAVHIMCYGVDSARRAFTEQEVDRVLEIAKLYYEAEDGGRYGRMD